MPIPPRSPSAVDGSTLVVTERGTDSISTYAIDERGYAAGPTTIKSSGKTPYGFDFTPDGAMIVTEAFGGAVGAAAASSYSLTDPGDARARERLGRRHPQRGLLGRGDKGRALRLRDELRRRDDLELRDRRGRQPRAARRRRGLDAPGREGHPRRGDHARRPLPVRDRRRRPAGASAGRSAATASSSRSERSTASPRRSPGSPRADRRGPSDEARAALPRPVHDSRALERRDPWTTWSRGPEPALRRGTLRGAGRRPRCGPRTFRGAASTTR